VLAGRAGARAAALFRGLLTVLDNGSVEALSAATLAATAAAVALKKEE
jgi:hypothetical protein